MYIHAYIYAKYKHLVYVYFDIYLSIYLSIYIFLFIYISLSTHIHRNESHFSVETIWRQSMCGIIFKYIEKIQKFLFFPEAFHTHTHTHTQQQHQPLAISKCFMGSTQPNLQMALRYNIYLLSKQKKT